MRQHARRPAPARAAADHGLAALLGDRDARRRLPLRPRRRAGPRSFHDVDKLSAFLAVHPAGPGGQPGQADRRAVGPRRGRLPGRRVPAAVDGVERQVPRRRARLLARPASRAASRELAYRLSGSSDLYQDDGRRPYASINFVTCHDGFTLRRPRRPTSTSTTRPTARTTGTAATTTGRWNCGVEGADRRPRVLALRARQMRNLLATLLLSTGVPMLRMGDEVRAPRAATTTPTARTTRSPGSTGTVSDDPASTCSTSPGG